MGVSLNNNEMFVCYCEYIVVTYQKRSEILVVYSRLMCEMKRGTTSGRISQLLAAAASLQFSVHERESTEGDVRFVCVCRLSYSNAKNI